MNQKKIKTIDELSKLINDLKNQGKKIIQCHGVFDLIHIGHIRHFEEAKSFADILVVSITPDQFVNKGPGRPAFTTELRLEALASLESIDYVVANNWSSAEELIKILKPNLYCKGPDYKDNADDITGKIDDENEAIKSVGGELVLTKDITFSSSNLLNKFGNLFSRNITLRFIFLGISLTRATWLLQMPCSLKEGFQFYGKWLLTLFKSQCARQI